MAKQLARELINAGVHFGHGVSRWNPKMAPFIFAKRGNIHVIDVKETLKGILIAKKLLAEIVSSGGDVVFVGTKRQAQKAVEAAANRCGMHFVSRTVAGRHADELPHDSLPAPETGAVGGHGTGWDHGIREQEAGLPLQARNAQDPHQPGRRAEDDAASGGRRGGGCPERVPGPAGSPQAEYPDGRRAGHGFRPGYGRCRNSRE